MLTNAVTGLNQLTQKPDTSCSDTLETSIAHHAQSSITVQPLTPPETTQSCTSIESLDGEDHTTNGILPTEELQSTDTVRDTRREPSTTETSLTVPTGLEESIRKLDTSSSENNPTGIVHHAHTTTEVTQPTELLWIRTLESTFTTS